MRKYIVVSVLFTLLFTPITVFAQQNEATSSAGVTEEEIFDFNKAYADYVFATTVYKKALSDYQLTRSQYLQAKTLAAQTKARNATVTLLQARDDVMTTYLTALRLKLSEDKAVTDADKEGLYALIDNDIYWYLNHKATIPSAGTLSDLIADSDEAKLHFELTKPLVYEILATIPSSNVGFLRNQADDILSSIKTKISEVRADGEKDTSNIERWIIETEQKLARSLDKQIEAQSAIAEIPTAGSSGPSRKDEEVEIYNTAIARLKEAHQFIRESTNFMKEIIRQLKIADQ